MPTLRDLFRSGWIAAALLAAALHMLVFDRGLGGDGWAGFAVLGSVLDDGDLWLEDDHRGVVNGLVGGRDGHLVSQYPPGGPLLDALPFLAGRTLDRLLPDGLLAGGAELPPAGRVPREVFLSAALIVLARNLATLLGLTWTALALLRLGVPERTAAAAVSLTFFGGPLLFYALVGMTHAPTFALAGLLLLLLVRQRETGSRRLAFVAGMVIGVAVLVRYSAVALLPPALAAVVFLPSPGGGRKGDGRGAGGEVLLVLAGFVLPLLALPFWWRACFGSWLAPPYGGRWVVTAASPWNVLFAPVHGLFLFHPALLFAAAGLILLASREISRRSLGWGFVALVWFLAVAVLHGWWSEWPNRGGYGQRFLIDALPPLALGFAAWLHPARRPALRTVPCVAAALAGWLLFFAAVGGLIPPPPPDPWPQRLGDYAPLVRTAARAGRDRAGAGAGVVRGPCPAIGRLRPEPVAISSGPEPASRCILLVFFSTKPSAPVSIRTGRLMRPIEIAERRTDEPRELPPTEAPQIHAYRTPSDFGFYSEHHAGPTYWNNYFFGPLDFLTLPSEAALWTCTEPRTAASAPPSCSTRARAGRCVGTCHLR